jgi:hypothetical protein
MSDSVIKWLADMPFDPEAIGTWLAVLLTLAVFSYILGQNIAFRLAEHLFVGVSAGYAGGLAWNHVILPRLELLLANPATYWYYALFFALGILLLLRGLRPLAALGDLPLGILVGTGSGLALGGALSGSLVAQMRASVISLAPADHGRGLVGWAFALDASLLLLGTLAVLSAFHYRAQGQGPLGILGNRFIRALGSLGRKFLMVGFGALLAGAALSFFALLTGRLIFLVSQFMRLFGRAGF